MSSKLVFRVLACFVVLALIPLALVATTPVNSPYGSALSDLAAPPAEAASCNKACSADGVCVKVNASRQLCKQSGSGCVATFC